MSTSAKKDRAEGASGKLTRKEAAHRLRCTVSQVRRFERQGRLTLRRAQPTGHCAVWYDTAEVDQLLSEWCRRGSSSARIGRVEERMRRENARGAFAQQIFPLLQQKRSLPEIVIATGADPLLVRELYKEFLLSLERGVSLEQSRSAEESERRAQVAHDRAARREEWRQHQERIALLQAQASGASRGFARSLDRILPVRAVPKPRANEETVRSDHLEPPEKKAHDA